MKSDARVIDPYLGGPIIRKKKHAEHVNYYSCRRNQPTKQTQILHPIFCNKLCWVDQKVRQKKSREFLLSPLYEVWCGAYLSCQYALKGGRIRLSDPRFQRNHKPFDPCKVRPKTEQQGPHFPPLISTSEITTVTAIYQAIHKGYSYILRVLFLTNRAHLVLFFGL